MSAWSALILALTGGALIGACARALDARRSQVARARLTLTCAFIGVVALASALVLGRGGA